VRSSWLTAATNALFCRASSAERRAVRSTSQAAIVASTSNPTSSETSYASVCASARATESSGARGAQS